MILLFTSAFAECRRELERLKLHSNQSCFIFKNKKGSVSILDVNVNYGHIWKTIFKNLPVYKEPDQCGLVNRAYLYL